MKETLIRLARSFIQYGGGALLAMLLHSPKAFVIAPVLAGLGKAIRMKHPDGEYNWIPF